MSVIRFTEAPIKSKPLNESGTLARVWLQWFSDVSDTIASYWGVANNAITMTGITSDIIVNKINLQGTTANIYLEFDGVDAVSSSFTIDSKYKVLDDVLRVTEYDGLNSSISWVFVENSSFSLPDISTNNKIIVSGTFLRDTGV